MRLLARCEYVTYADDRKLLCRRGYRLTRVCVCNALIALCTIVNKVERSTEFESWADKRISSNSVHRLWGINNIHTLEPFKIRMGNTSCATFVLHATCIVVYSKQIGDRAAHLYVICVVSGFIELTCQMMHNFLSAPSLVTVLEYSKFAQTQTIVE